MKKTRLFLILISVFSIFNSYAQDNCFNHTSYIACYASGYDEYQKIPPPDNFSRGERTATINATLTGFNTADSIAFYFAKNIWEGVLITTVPIKLNAYLLPLGSGGLLGITFPNGRKNFSGAPVADRWYATSLANQLAGAELNVGEADIDLVLNANNNWYFGTDGNCPVGKYDFVSVVLHEMCHGFGFVGLAKIDSLGVGSFGELQSSDFMGVSPSFPWPQLDTFPGIFDHFLVDADTLNLDDTLNYFNPSLALDTAFTCNNIYWNGSFGIAAANNFMPRIYAPATWALGSSMVHLNEASYPVGNANELMTPFATSHSSNHNPGPICFGMLKDIGWNLDFSSIESAAENNLVEVFPNPASQMLLVNCYSLLGKNPTVTIFNLEGKEIETVQLNSKNEIDVSSFANGIYFLKINADNGNYFSKFVKD